MKNICCIGHITLDKVITPRFEAHMPAEQLLLRQGSQEFRPYRLYPRHLPWRIRDGVVEELRSEGIDVKVIPSRKSVYFENKYGEDMNNRTQRVLAKADPFTAENLRDINADIYHLGTLLADDFDLDTIKALAAKGTVAVDVQGYLRKVTGEDAVHVDYDKKREAMPYISILKANEKEMEVLTGTTDPRRAAKILSGWGCREVLLTLGDKGSIIYTEGVFHEIPALPPADLVDATGCGDTYMAGYLYKRSRGASYQEAGTFAAAMCTLKLQDKGAFSGTEEDVEKLIRNSQKLTMKK